MSAKKDFIFALIALLLNICSYSTTLFLSPQLKTSIRSQLRRYHGAICFKVTATYNITTFIVRIPLFLSIWSYSGRC